MVTALVTLLIFLVMITLHEFGHFIVAKMLKVNVLEFAIGMGPAIFKKQGKETLYSLRAFPIGGYCSLDGEDGGSDNEGAFCNQKLWKRILIVSAGAILNLILGFVLFVVFVSMTSPFSSNTIEKVDERSYLSEVGVYAGDKIVAINGHKVNFYNDISLYTQEFTKDSEFDLTVKRNGEKLDFTLKPSEAETRVTYGENYADVVDIINGKENSYRQEFGDTKVPDSYVGETFTTTRLIIGFEPKKVEVTAFNVIPQAWNYTVYMTKNIYSTFGKLITGRAGLDNVSGPVGVAQIVDGAVKSGEYTGINIILIVAMLTINLGIFNLLPLPALDGGRLFFMLIELVRGKPIPPEKEGIVHTVGLMLLLALAVVVCFNDILRILG
ncbi:MAG: site-2 protease family protein [Clostridia bacterium]|nr:site-2 protease family protein [Clostridia bacterium]